MSTSGDAERRCHPLILSLSKDGGRFSLHSPFESLRASGKECFSLKE